VKLEKTNIEGLLILHPRVFSDDRGYFMESFNSRKFESLIGMNKSFVQDNESLSDKDVLRGLHFQIPPMSQAKLIRVVRGSVLDIVVDLRSGSSTFGAHYSLELSGNNKKQLYVPEGMAHGFLTLEDNTCFVYKCTDYYSPDHDRTILWNDPELNIDWGCDAPIVSEKDQRGLSFNTFETPFKIDNTLA
jgi:dTDP-4-dehydrorhamnose 3,5-epimerase